jgi:hypothetical protein
MRRSRSGRQCTALARVSRSTTRSSAGSWSPTASETARPPASSPRSGASSERSRHAVSERSASVTASVVSPLRCAISSGVGVRPPNRCSSSRRAWPTRLRASCTGRGSRNSPLRSRRWRLISPVTVGSA